MVEGRALEANNIQIEKRPGIRCYSKDVSEEGIGVAVELWDMQRGISQGYQTTLRFELISNAHVNYKELEVLGKVLKGKERDLKGRTLLWSTDNITAREMVQRQGSQNIRQELWSLAKRVVVFTLERDIRLLPRYISGRLISATDHISRLGEIFSLWKKALTRVINELGT